MTATGEHGTDAPSSATNGHAQMYLARGWPLLVCHPRSKEPLGELVPHGVKDATTDPEVLAGWLRRCPDANLAVACGHPGPQVLDIDNPAAVPAAVAMAVMKAPRTISPRGGAAFFAGTDAATINLGWGELRGHGSYQLVPPSIHPTGKEYVWLQEPRGKLPPAPALEGHGQKAGSGEHRAPPRPIIAGEGRHPYMKDYAVRIVRSGITDQARIAAHLEREFELSCEPHPPPSKGYFDRLAKWAAESNIAGRERSHDGQREAGSFKARAADAAAFYPVTFAWERRLVRGVINIFAGEEGVGKGTLETWVIARLTKGELPGHFREKPVRVLWIGDEDGFRQVVGPRLHAAGADLANVAEVVGDNGSLLNVTDGAEQLDRLVKSGPFEVVVFEQLLDNLGALRNPNDPYEVRSALRPMRHVLHRRETTVTATLHTNKLRTGDFRSRLGGSHQYNAVARSSLLIAHHPDASGRRVLVGGKANYSASPIPLAFEVRSHRFPMNGFEFEVPLACEFAEAPDLDIETVLDGPPKPRPRDEVRDALREAIREGAKCHSLKELAPGTLVWTLAELATMVGRKSKDGTLRRAVDELVDEGVLQRGEDKRYRPAPTLFDDEEDA